MGKARCAGLLVFLLVVALLAPRAWAGPGGPGRTLPPGSSLPQELNLTPQQRERLDALSARIRGLNRDLGQRLYARRGELEGIYARAEIDEARARRLRLEIHEIQGQMLELHHQFQVEIRKILTADQFTRLQESRRKRRGPPRRHRRGRGPSVPAGPPSGAAGAGGMSRSHEVIPLWRNTRCDRTERGAVC